MRKVFVPMIYTPNEAPVVDQSEPEPVLLSVRENALLGVIAQQPEQRRASLRPHALLMWVARARATDMATRGYVSHVDPNGLGANWHVRETGFVLPGHYQYNLDANNVESIAAGQAAPSEAVEGWRQSVGHWTHVAGLKDFYAGQDAAGVGYAFSAEVRYGHYWVFISAPWGDN